MDLTTTRFVFALLCLGGLVAIATAAVLEILRARRGQSLLSRRHLRWRMLSAAVWVLMLGMLSYGTFFEWPSGPQDKEGFFRFTMILAASMMMMMVASLLFFFDLFLTMRSRKVMQQKMGEGLSAMAQREIDRVRSNQSGGKKQNGGRQ